jgi:hypothetical protein
MTAADVEAYAGATLAGRRLYLYGCVGPAVAAPVRRSGLACTGPVPPVRCERMDAQRMKPPGWAC